AVCDGVPCGSLGEADGAARRLPGPQQLAPLVDLLERVRPADQLVELQPAVEVELDELWEIDGRADRAVERALERLLLERHRVGRDRRPRGHRRHADDDGGATGADRVEDLERGGLAPDRVEGVVGPWGPGG